MTTETNKPTHNVVRYYGEGRNASNGRVGAIWPTDKGNLLIVLENPFGTEKIVLTAFPNENRQ